jgi:hypothetical protein
MVTLLGTGIPCHLTGHRLITSRTLFVLGTFLTSVILSLILGYSLANLLLKIKIALKD